MAMMPKQTATGACSERRFILGSDAVTLNRLGLAISLSLRSKQGQKREMSHLGGFMKSMERPTYTDL